ncbi:MAG TPA: hypothetical protein H9903_06270 [Candidatus Aquabacterium excrementipullorum]|nr:hypothetical protein [Candidatus Aquabacterium excrementipullorum]
MAQVLMSPPTGGRKLIVALGAVAAVAMAAAWWTHSAPPEPVMAAPEAAPATAPQVQMPGTASPEAQLSDMKAKQSEAAQALASRSDVKPMSGVITERPSFVSPMEWMVLKGTASQHANPEHELTRMVNFLRYNKQNELLQELPHTAEAQPRRQALANELLADLPQRLLNGEMSLKDLRSTQAELLKDAESDPEQRQIRAQTEAKRLEQALASLQAGGQKP